MLMNRFDLPERLHHMGDCIAPVDNMPAGPMAQAVIDEYERKNPIIFKIRSIPHLRLDLPVFDLETALREIHQYYTNDDFMQLNLAGLPLDQGGHYYHFSGMHPEWGSRALINYTPSSKGTWGKEDREIAIREYPHYQQRAARVIGRRVYLSDMNFYTTEVWDSLPYITKYITDNIASVENLRRSHLYRLKAGGRLAFHNHRLLPWEVEAAPHDEGIVHIPLITHPNAAMCEQIGDSDIVDVQHYAAGEGWLLNTYMNHAVNGVTCPVDRLHLVIMSDFGDPKFVDLIERSLAKNE